MAVSAAAATRSGGSTRSLLRKLGIPHSGQMETGEGGAPTLTEVELQHKKISAEMARVLCGALRANATITCLKVGCNELGDEGAEAVAQALEHHVSLTTVDLGFNSIGDRGAVALGRALRTNRRLRTLYLSGNCIAEPGARALAGAVAENRCLTVLHLTGNAIGPEGAAALADGLAANSTLRKLYLAGNAIGPRGSCCLFSALANNSGIRALYLSDNQIGDQGVYALSHVLQQNRMLSVLELGFNHITHLGLEYLFSSLCGYTALQQLHLDNNTEIGDVGADYAAAALPSMSLDLLNLGFCSLSTTGVRSLMRAVGTNGSLRSLTLSGNQLDTEGARAVAQALSANCTLQELFLDHTAIGHAGERFIAAGIDANKAGIGLRTLTGFRLGHVLARMGYPPELEAYTNEQTLDYLRESSSSSNSGIQPGGAPGGGIRVYGPHHQPAAGAMRELALGGNVGCRVLAAAMGNDALHAPLGLAGAGPPALARGALFMEGSGPGEMQQQQQQHHLLHHHHHPHAGLPPAFAAALHECARRPFDPSELFMLHQYYFSPPPNPMLLQERSAACDSSGAPATAFFRVESEDRLPPTKRQCNNLTKPRLAYYPRLKSHVEVLLKSGHEAAVLVLLRQLRYLEEDALRRGAAPSVLDVEALLLDAT